MYADRITKSMKIVIEETNRRRQIQEEYNKQNNINPETIYKTIEEIMSTTSIADIGIEKNAKREAQLLYKEALKPLSAANFVPNDQLENYINELYTQMKEAAKNLDFEQAATLRDEIAILKKKLEIINAK
ncbi:UvrABC system protein B [bioreactor metagenome]|uniref:UvrABC system protein B n=1 Tax=bioreactor metagenome TaxID=1076179 RepID=A0A645HSW3_9ZZZZ